jgi:HEPN domain-containing protein
LSRRDSRDLAGVLARKAEGDAKAMRRLASDPEIDDAAVGFHAQQALEKWMKAVIAVNGLRFKKEHDLGLLLEVLDEGGVAAPPGADWLDELTIYAVPMRYEDLLDVEPLDRDAVLALVAEVGDWAAGFVKEE